MMTDTECIAELRSLVVWLERMVDGLERTHWSAAEKRVKRGAYDRAIKALCHAAARIAVTS